MTHQDWISKDADPQGLVSLGLLHKRAAELTRQEFVDVFPVPALLFVHQEQMDGEAETVDLDQPKVQLLTLTIESAAILRYLNRVMFLAKRPGNPFPHLIAIGRSAKNDLVIAVETVSKMHGYFVNEDGQWHFTDHGSTNGSRLNDRMLEPRRKMLLSDHDLLQLGSQVVLEFLGPEALYDRVKR